MILQAKMNKTDDSQTEPFISCQLIKEGMNISKPHLVSQVVGQNFFKTFFISVRVTYLR